VRLAGKCVFDRGALFSQRDAFGILLRFLSCRPYLGTKAGGQAKENEEAIKSHGFW